MFQKSIDGSIRRVSHRLIESPQKSLYVNHIHNHCEVLLFLRGKADYYIDGQLFTLSPFDLLFIPAATYHYLILTDTEPYENYVIDINPSSLDPQHYTKLFSDPLLISIKDDRELTSFFSRLDTYYEKYSEKDFEKAASALVSEFIIYCSYRKDELHSGQSRSYSRIDGIIKYISENMEESIDAESIARHFMFSKSYVQNIFSQNMHIGLKKYIMQKKIYAAHSDLLSGISPYVVCEKYSFGDYSVFYRLYKKTFGKSPKKADVPKK